MEFVNMQTKINKLHRSNKKLKKVNEKLKAEC